MNRQGISTIIPMISLIGIIMLVAVRAGAEDVNDQKTTEVITTKMVSEDSSEGEGVLKEPSVERFLPLLRTWAADTADIVYDQQTLIQINRSLRHSLEENRRLRLENQDLERELGQLRGQRRIQSGNLITVTEERDQLDQKLKAAELINTRSSVRLRQREEEMNQKDGEFLKKISTLELQMEEQENKLEDVLAEKKELETLAAPVKEDIEKTQQADHEIQAIVTSIEDLNRTNEQLKADSGRVHYNLGNIHFHKGDYPKAIEEYKKAIVFNPNDAHAHYNLAYVSGEYFGDYRTALKHYEQYLYLRPDADDVLFVREKIIDATLFLKTIIDSPIDRYHPDRAGHMYTGSRKRMWEKM